MRGEGLNLARRPFVNSRPVTRIALLFWLLGGLLLLGNVALFWSYVSGSGEKRAELAEVERRIAREREAIARLEDQVSGLDLRRQNRQVLFLNGKIAERTFSWSLLFDRVAEVLPQDVRLFRLDPEGVVEKRPGQPRPRGESDGRVTLNVTGEAKTGEALLQLVDSLFAHPAFAEPDLTHERRGDDGIIQFDLQVGYLPTVLEAPQTATVEEEIPAAAPAVPEPTAGGGP